MPSNNERCVVAARLREYGVEWAQVADMTEEVER